MLLIMQNLPYSVTYNDIKALIYSKCGIAEIILDNLVPHDNRTKKVTIGLSGDEDAAIVMKKVNGTMMSGHKLQVMSKPKFPNMPANTYQSSGQRGIPVWNKTSPDTNQLSGQAGIFGSMPNYGSQESNWSTGPNFKPPPPPRSPNQNAPAMVPPPMAFGGPNMFYPNPNQHAYYTMNQPTYSTNPSGPSIGYQTVPYSNMGNQSRAQNSWSSNNWNQQQQSSGFQNVQPKKERDQKWGDNDSNWDNRGSDWDNSPSKWDRERGSIQESRWNNNDGSNDPRSNNSNGSNWQSNRDAVNRDSNMNRDSNRDTFRPNQTAGSSRDHNVSYRTSDQNNPSRESFHFNNPSRESFNIYGQHVTCSSGDRFDQKDNEPQQNRYKTTRQHSTAARGRMQSPFQRRQQNVDSDFVHGGRFAKGDNKTLSERQYQVGRTWRGQFIATKARQILSDPRFEYETPDQDKLLKALTANIKKRLSNHLENDYTLKMNQLEKIYNKTFGYKTNWEVLRDSLLKVGGRLLSKLEAGPAMTPSPGMMPPPSKKPKKNKAANTQQAPQYGNKAFGNLKMGQRADPKASSAKPPPQVTIQHVDPYQALMREANKKKKAGKAGKKNPGSIPLALIPGRIPQYPQGDKQLFKQQKRVLNTVIASDLSSNIFDCLNPDIRRAIKEEVDLMCNVIDEVCTNPEITDEKVVKFGNSVKAEVPSVLRKTLKVNLARRIIPILPAVVRVFASPPIKRVPLEEFLKDYNVSSILKSVHGPYYVVHCNTIEDHDALCLMKSVVVAGSTLNFKPFQMVDMKNLSKGAAAKKRKRIVSGLIKNENQAEPNPTNEGADEDNNDDYGDEQRGDDNEGEGSTSQPINDSEPNVSGNDTADNQDFTTDISINNATDNTNIETAKNSLTVGQDAPGDDTQIENPDETGENKPIEDSIDFADVNDDDLEDW